MFVELVVVNAFVSVCTTVLESGLITCNATSFTGADGAPKSAVQKRGKSKLNCGGVATSIGVRLGVGLPGLDAREIAEDTIRRRQETRKPANTILRDCAN